MEDNQLHDSDRAKEDHRYYSLYFFFFLRTPEILAKNAQEHFYSTIIFLLPM